MFSDQKYQCYRCMACIERGNVLCSHLSQYFNNANDALLRSQYQNKTPSKEEGFVIDGECEDITNKRALPELDNE